MESGIGEETLEWLNRPASSRIAQAVFRLLLEASPLPMLRLAPGAVPIVAEANEIAERLFGYPPEALDGLPLGALIPGLVSRHPGEYEALRQDGVAFPVELAFAPGGFVSLVDITERRRSADLFRLAVEACPTAMLMVDAAGRVTMANRHAGILLGYAIEELVGLRVDALVPAAARAGHSGNRAGFAASPVARPMGGGRTLTCLRKDGSEVAVELGLNPVGDYVLCSILDVTDRLLQQRQLEDSCRAASTAREVAEAATAAKSDFLASMSHEIRTPLNGVLGMARILLDTQLDTEQREYAEIVVRSGERLMGIIDEILDASKLDAGKVVLESAPFDVAPLCLELVDLFSARAAEKGLDLIFNFPPHLPPRALGDSLRLHQVLANLIGNAIKFTESGYVLVTARCRAWRGRSLWRFTVLDTGIGIAADRVPHIFESFEQADNSTSRRYGGSGLGLSISSRLVQLMGGRVRVSTRPGVGSRFRVVVPLGPAVPSLPVTLPALPASATLLVYAPHPVRRRVLAAQLAAGAARVCWAASPAAVLAALSTAPDAYALLLAEVPPGDEETLALAARLRGRLPVVLLAASPSPGDRTRFEEVGVAAYLVQPIAAAALLQALAAVLQPAAAPLPDPVPHAAPPPAPFQNRRVLVVDDDRVNQLVAVRMLERLGVAVDVANDGFQALRQSTRRHYDAIFMDCQMPVMDGYAATAALRARESAGRHTPVIAVTAAATESDRELCLGAGMDDYVVKPISAPALLAALDRCLSR